MIPYGISYGTYLLPIYAQRHPGHVQSIVLSGAYRADRTRATPGSGLGLAIVHDIITAHSGSVFAANRPGGGAEVGFQLPGER